MSEASASPARGIEPLDPEALARLRFFEGMDRVNRAIQGTNDLEKMLSDVLEAVLAVLDCDRAWLLYPCDPASPTWRVQMECFRPEYPGALPASLDVPMSPEVAQVFERARAAPGPVKAGHGGSSPLSPRARDVFHVKSALGVAIYPRGDAPYLFGIHQCSRPRDFTPEDLQIFQEIGRRLADALTSLLAVRGLRESEARYRCFMDNATDAFFLLNERGILEDVNRQACESLGFARDELIGRTPELFATEVDPAALARIMACIGGGGQIARDTRHRRKDGSTFPVEVRSRRMEGAGRWWAVSIARDISERKVAEEALQKSERRHRAFFETSNAGMVAIGPGGIAVRANEAFCAMMGYSPDEVRSRPVPDFLFPEDVPRVREAWAAMMSGRTDRFAGEQRYLRRDGTALWTLTNVVVLARDDSGAPVASSAVIIDLTERKRLEEHLQRAQKMEAIGQLAGGVAHDFNNLLTVINGYSEVLLASLSEDEGLRDAATVIRDAGERAARLTSQLLAFSRKAVVEPKVLDLNGVVEATSRMLSRLLGEDVTLVTQLQPDLPRVLVDPGQIEQVLMNLTLNARDAMPKGGRITICTDDVATGVGGPWAEDLPPGRHVRLRVSDTGAGMTDEVRRRIFEPFFTTKGVGRGTGLGLATVYGIIQQARGAVVVDSHVGKGTTFSVLLPVTSAPALPRRTQHRAAAAASETILIVEDEEAVRRLARRLLERRGHVILEAAGGLEALRLVDDFAGQIDLLLTDVVMPGMDGRDLADAVRARRPAIKVLYMSGFTDDAVARHGISSVTDTLLQKPFSTEMLVQRVRETLDGAAALRRDVER